MSYPILDNIERPLVFGEDKYPFKELTTLELCFFVPGGVKGPLVAAAVKWRQKYAHMEDYASWDFEYEKAVGMDSKGRRAEGIRVWRKDGRFVPMGSTSDKRVKVKNQEEEVDEPITPPPAVKNKTNPAPVQEDWDDVKKQAAAMRNGLMRNLKHM